MVSAWMMGGFIPLTSLLNCQRNFNGGGAGSTESGKGR